ncbi:SPFH domain-containing protein [Desulfococcaceae bacterium HSG9]|nr:SPFH domain-containing protein [Desulfococcaceae bacterium HSG9]
MSEIISKIGEIAGKLTGKIGFIVTGIGLLFFVFVIFPNILYTVERNHVGVIFDNFGSESKVAGRFIVEKGEKGWWREPLMPGTHFFWLLQPLWQYKIKEEPFVRVPAGKVGIVYARDGESMRPGQILADPDVYPGDMVDGKKATAFKIGQKGPRLKVLEPGHYPINSQYLEVKLQPAIQIPEGNIGIMTRKIGDEPPIGTVLVNKDSQYRGIVREILNPGTYYFNPKAVKVQIVKAVVITKGQVGIVTKKVGKMPPGGTILVEANDEYQGIQREVLQPGMHYINPYQQDVKIENAVQVPDGHVGVQIAKTGDGKPVDQLLAKPGQRGILEETLSPGLYYINPYETEVVVVDIRQQRYEMTYIEGMGDTQQSDAIVFYSDDGFIIAIDLTVLYQVLPQDTPHVVATVGRTVKDIRDKIIRPQARSLARILGSKYKGEDYVHGETRETFQNNLDVALRAKSVSSKIQVNQALVRHFEVPDTLRGPITAKVIALKMQEKYEQEQETQKANAVLAGEREKVTFESEKIKAETRKAKAIIAAEEQRDVEKLNMEKKEFIALGDAKQKKIQADADLYMAQQDAKGILARKKSEGDGDKVIIEAWNNPGAKNKVALKMAEVLQGARLIPLEMIFGGGGKGGGGGNAPFMYGDTLDILKFLGVKKMEEMKQQGAQSQDKEN